VPGTYSLRAVTPDEKITEQVLTGHQKDESVPDLILCVVDASNLQRGLRLALELKALGHPMMLALNMMDIAAKKGLEVDVPKLSAMLGMPVVETIAVSPQGIRALCGELESFAKTLPDQPPSALELQTTAPEVIHAEVNRVLKDVMHAASDRSITRSLSYQADRWVLNPVTGPLIFAVLMFLVFQAVFVGADSDGIHQRQHGRSRIAGGNPYGTGRPSGFAGQRCDWRRWQCAGVPAADSDSVLLYSGDGRFRLPAARRLPAGSLNGESRFVRPRIHSAVIEFACAVPGIMATRTIQNPRDRLITIMIAPLMTCSARLPVYALIIAAFIPDREVLGIMNLQGLVLFGLYIGGIVSAMLVALFFKHRWGNAAPNPNAGTAGLSSAEWPAIWRWAYGSVPKSSSPVSVRSFCR
jgi:ferrous iron transport protein B